MGEGPSFAVRTGTYEGSVLEVECMQEASNPFVTSAVCTVSFLRGYSYTYCLLAPVSQIPAHLPVLNWRQGFIIQNACDLWRVPGDFGLYVQIVHICKLLLCQHDSERP